MKNLKEKVNKKIDLSRLNEDFINQSIDMALNEYAIENSLDGEIKIEKIIKKCNFEIQISDNILIDDAVGMMLLCDDTRKICLNGNYSYEEIKYAMLYLLGKYLVEYNGTKDYVAICRDQNRKIKSNYYADMFTLGILMPKEQFISKYSEMEDVSSEEKINRLSDYFHVSYDNVNKYLKRLTRRKELKYNSETKILVFKKI